MGTSTQLSTSSMSPASPMSLQPVGQSTDQFICQEDILQDGGIRYLVRRHLVGHQDMEDYNFTDLFDSKDATGDATVICTNKSVSSTDQELFFVKAHKHVLVKSCSFFQHYFEPFLETHSMSTLIIPSINASTMDQWLQLFYTNQVILKFDDMVSFWSAAEILKVDHVEPIYKWVYYIETLQPVIENSPGSVPTTSHYENLLPFHAATGNGTKSSPTDGQAGTGQYQQPTTIVQQVVPVTVSISQESSQELPIFILRAITAPSQVSLPNTITNAGDPLSPVIYLSDGSQVHQTGHQNMNATPSSPTAGDIAMAMLSANPEQRCRLVYDTQGNPPEKGEQPLIISSSSSQSSPRPFLIPHMQDKAMVMCPACLLVLNQENFADHKLICTEYKRSHSSAIHIPIPPLLPSPPPPKVPTPPPPPPPPASSPLKIFRCPTCIKAFVTIKGLKAHLPIHNKMNKAGKPPTPVSKEQSDSSPTSPVPPKMKKPSFPVPLKKVHPPAEKHRPVPSSSMSSPPDSHQ